MTKTKMSTVAIVVLSVLLAAALAATIVLAAFAFTGSATTTIKFANGVEIEATGITKNAWDAYVVGTDGIKGNKISDTTATQTTGVALSAITIKNTSGKEIKVAVAVIVTDAGSKTAPDMFVSSNDGSAADKKFAVTTALKQSTATGANFGQTTGSDSNESSKTNTKAASVTKWVVYTVANDATITACNWINTNFDAKSVDEFADKAFTANFYVAAAYDTAGLEQAIEDGSFTGFNA